MITYMNVFQTIFFLLFVKQSYFACKIHHFIFEAGSEHIKVTWPDF